MGHVKINDLLKQYTLNHTWKLKVCEPVLNIFIIHSAHTAGVMWNPEAKSKVDFYSDIGEKTWWKNVYLLNSGNFFNAREDIDSPDRE